jgi:hypothetical protein
MSAADRSAMIARLNDALRRQHRGGRVMITQGVQALGPEFVAQALAAVASFDRFDADNDPYGERDCAIMTVGAERLLWKIDYYDRSLSAGSPDPADPTVTVRVLTVMRAEEY